MRPPHTAFQRRAAIRFGAATLDRVSERRDDAAWLDAQIRQADAREVLLDAQGRVLVDRTGDALWTLPDRSAPDVLLGLEQGAPRFARLIDATQVEPLAAHLEGRWRDLRSYALGADPVTGGLVAMARGLLYWQHRHRWCGACGHATVFEQAGHRARCIHPPCGAEHFPRTDPAIIVIVTEGEAALLGRQAVWPAKRYSTLAGFVEPGESLEDAVRREVQEESGVQIRDCDYFGSQPWPFPASLMLGFVAEAVSREIRRGDELEDVRWFEPDDFIAAVASGEILPPPALSVSHSLIAHWLWTTRRHVLAQNM